jgi:transcription termination factor Rho
VLASGTRHDEMVLARDERAVIAQVRRALAGQDRKDALRQLLDQLRGTASNHDFLRKAARGLASA